MIYPFVDTDVLIRLLTGDVPQKQAAARSLFKRVEEGEITLLAPDTVIADAVFVLASPRLYHIPREEVRNLLASLIGLPHFRVQNKQDLLRALEIYASTNLDFGDTMIIASMEEQDAHILYSYDTGFDRIKGLTRQEPTAHSEEPEIFY